MDFVYVPICIYIALLYTPHNEHFGIVPIEAMYLECPVIAVNAGGPKETVVDDRTGFLCEQTSAAFAEAMRKFIDNNPLNNDDTKSGIMFTLRQRLGKAGKLHVQVIIDYHSLYCLYCCCIYIIISCSVTIFLFFLLFVI